MAIRPHIRHAVFQQHTGNPFGRQPITHLRALKIDGQTLIAPAREDDDRSARILPLWRIHRHRRPRYVEHAHHRPAGNQPLLPRRRRSNLRPRDRLGIRHRPRPYRHLRMSRRWLPNRRLRAQTATRKDNTESKEQSLHQGLHHNPPRGRIEQDELSSQDRSGETH